MNTGCNRAGDQSVWLFCFFFFKLYFFVTSGLKLQLSFSGLGNMFGVHELRENMDKSTELKMVEKYLMPHLIRW